MFKTLHPDLGSILSFPKHVMLWIKSGYGSIEVDFKKYTDFQDRLLFLSPGQPIKFTFGDFELALLEFPPDFVLQSKDYRVLFKHLIALGYVDLSGKKQDLLTEIKGNSPQKILDLSTHQWFWQNPFNAEKEEYQLIFDLKDAIDAHFHENWSVEQFVHAVDKEYYSLHKIIRARLGLTIKALAQHKILIESQKKIALTAKPIQEVAHELGFRDPAYFNRFFKRHTQVRPLEFRKQFGASASDPLIEDLVELIRLHHRSHRTASFYAQKTFTSAHALSKKVREKFDVSLGQLIRLQLVKSAEELLLQTNVKETAYELGFREANHFSTFFKKYAGLTPSEFQLKKSNK